MLAATSANNSAAPGILGFVIVFALAVVLVFVFRSMSKHIRKVNEAARREEAARAEASRPAQDKTAPVSTNGQPASSPHDRPRT